MKVKRVILILLPIFVVAFSISYFSPKIVPGNSGNILITQNDDQIECSEIGCEGVYIGPEFVNGSDVAHQFSNTMSGRVGDKLKALYDAGEYSKVDFVNITMSTEGMGSGKVVYKLRIPFERVAKKCDSYTSFDHVGGWNHKPDLIKRKSELDNAPMDGEELNISELKTTPEGLQEYWIQWKNKIKQADCN